MKKVEGMQVSYRRWVQTNLRIDNLFMFDLEEGRPEIFFKNSSLAFDRYLFTNFVDTNAKRFAGIKFVNVITETLYF